MTEFDFDTKLKDAKLYKELKEQILSQARAIFPEYKHHSAWDVVIVKDIEYTGKYFARVIVYTSSTTWMTAVKLGNPQLTAVAALDMLLELLRVKLWDTIKYRTDGEVLEKTDDEDG